MKTGFALAIQQKQSLLISAQMIQSLVILQFSQEELQSYVAEKAERNPFIRVSGNSRSASLSSTPATAAGVSQPADGGPHKVAGARMAGTCAPGTGIGHLASSAEFATVETWYAARPSLRDHLLAQIGLAFRDRTNRIVATAIVENVDDDGFMRRDLQEIAEAAGVSIDRVERVLESVQSFDPAGICARNLSECLRLQLEDRGMLTAAMGRLLDNIHVLAEFDYPKLASICRVSCERVIAMANEIRKLDPRPGRRFDPELTLPAVPDVIVERADDGHIKVELNSEFLPRVLVDREYYAEVKAHSRDEEGRRFAATCIKEASWLVSKLEQRARTMLLVATEIAVRQEKMLEHGVEHIAPLRLKDVADAIGVNESTVCRAIANKFMMTRHGMFDLKRFFTNPVSSADGGAEVSAEAVRHRIRQMIDSETVQNVLSDDAIVKALHRSGIGIARRTVAKYREAMRIPCSLQRRREKRAVTDFPKARTYHRKPAAGLSVS
ncbi:RNA polymerase RpoN-/SigL-like sigma 54 subunit [Rhodovulum imhoffii]|uniref:RNA polymerase sigma-54 factor n=1 Tax=Rhodovulum imhoffii TaxID=365340 RepID=A0A2T5BL35_9RHOB|nr:RNA polymerase factor sigma-54 [Rhodovulum imhoffii]MBK5933653.1 RNA polymerase sigma-54 factor [Rhodovulum imhoffii]PTM99713.1 RNA polymerase RpoN-/SigL-like sigma 54 subunit [Rhodovulum imhoffii]